MNELFAAFETLVRRVITEEVTKHMTAEIVASNMSGTLRTSMIDLIEAQLDERLGNTKQKIDRAVESAILDFNFDDMLDIRIKQLLRHASISIEL